MGSEYDGGLYVTRTLNMAALNSTKYRLSAQSSCRRQKRRFGLSVFSAKGTNEEKKKNNLVLCQTFDGRNHGVPLPTHGGALALEISKSLAVKARPHVVTGSKQQCPAAGFRNSQY